MNGAQRFFARASLIGIFVSACTALGQHKAGDEVNGPQAQPTASEGGAAGEQAAAAGAAEAGSSGSSSEHGAGAHAHGGSGSGAASGTSPGGVNDPGVHATGVPGDGALPGAAGADNGDDAGAGGGGAGPAPECDMDGGCTAVCHGQSARCTVAHAGFSCELAQYENAAATVACGETATIGIANCGGCGTVTVKVYFDGKYCWEGMPECALSGLTGTFFVPHSPE